MPKQLVFEQHGHEIKGAPLLRWAGGKRSLLKSILPLLPNTFNRYYEPFLGGGALFFALQPKTSILSDSNADLINSYIQVRDRPDEVIASPKKLKNTEQDYYKIREREPADDVAKAARLIYLSALSFNGFYRLNAKGKFNVPYGHRPHLNPCDPARIREAQASRYHQPS
jgi:DNA adenine methylase